jgi:glucokinase
MSREVAIGIDIGGTKIRAGLVDRSGHVLSDRQCPTDPSRLLDDVLSLAQRVQSDAASDGLRPEGIGVGTTGFVDRATGELVRSLNLRLEAVPLGKKLRQAFDLPISVDNDLHATTLGEARFGVGRDHSDFILVNAGTGIAVGMVFAGRLHRGASNASGEFGHTRMEISGGPRCTCGARGCLEALVVAARAGRAPERPPFKDQNDPPLGAEYRYLALGIVNVVNLLNPPIVVLAGGMFTENEAAVEAIRRAVRTAALPLAVRGLQRIVMARAGRQAGLVGAASLVFEAR